MNHFKISNSNYIYSLLLILGFFSGTLQGQSFWDQFKDTTDNKLDFSNYWASKAGFMPYTGIITEPALGFGLVLGLVFLDPFTNQWGKSVGSVMEAKGAPPDMAVPFGFITQNGSWGTGLLYKGYWKRDRWRYSGFLGYVAVNLDYYGNGEINLPKALTLNYEGMPFSQELHLRFISRWFAGLRYFFFKYDISPANDGNEVPEYISDQELKGSLAALSPIIYFDNRDNIFTPNSGIMGKVVLNVYDNLVGSDFDFLKMETYGIGYIPTFNKKLIIGLRYDGQFSGEGTPFYSLPSIDLRGIPSMRYQGRHTLVLETEERWNVSGRWSLIGFLGVGKAFTDPKSFSNQPAYGAGGAGIRYFVARKFDLYGGIDVARGPENWALYLTAGSAWGKY